MDSDACADAGTSEWGRVVPTGAAVALVHAQGRRLRFDEWMDKAWVHADVDEAGSGTQYANSFGGKGGEVVDVGVGR
jgi:hypothetical protein